MYPAMGRRRTRDHDLPPGMVRKNGRFYYGRNQVALGADEAAALRAWAEIRGEQVADEPKTFALAAALFERDELASRAPKTQAEYRRQLKRLTKVFGRQPLADIGSGDVWKFMQLRPKIAGTRDKALLSLIFNFGCRVFNLRLANPCAAVRGTKSSRKVSVADVQLGAVLAVADRPLRDFLELSYRTGADASVVLAMTRQDVQDGALRAARSKTGRIAAVEIDGPLGSLLARLLALSFPVQSMHLILDERGQGMNLQAMRKRFWKARRLAGQTWQIRDLRAKAATDSESIEEARKLLAHADESTTASYRRARSGERARPPMREIADNVAAFTDKPASKK